MTAQTSPTPPRQCVNAEAPFLVIEAEGNPRIRVDARLLDTIEVEPTDVDGFSLILEASDFRAGLYVAGGVTEAAGIVSALVPYTRNAPITSHEVFIDARSRADNTHWLSLTGADEHVVDVTNVYIKDARLHVFGFVFLLEDVEHYGERAADLPLGPGRAIQAAIALLIAHTRRRAEIGEDVELLRSRISEYESRRKGT